MMLIGGLGSLGLASHRPGGGHRRLPDRVRVGLGWSGLTFALVLVASGGHPGSSGAFLQAGGMLGSAAGPVLMTLAVQVGGMGSGWFVMGAAIASAGLLVAPRRAADRTAPCTDGVYTSCTECTANPAAISSRQSPQDAYSPLIEGAHNAT
jgi:hypothetical protein